MKKYFIYCNGSKVKNKHFPTNEVGYSSENAAMSAINNVEKWLTYYYTDHYSRNRAFELESELGINLNNNFLTSFLTIKSK